MSLLPLAACNDPTAQQHAQARAELDRALALIHEANQGFVPDIVADKPIDLESFRYSKYEQALPLLEKVISTAAPDLVGPAQSLAADLYAATARHHVDQAKAGWASLSLPLAKSTALLLAIESYSDRAELFDVNQSPLLSQLNGYENDANRQLQPLQDKLKSHEQAIAAMENQQAALKSEATALLKDSQSAQDRAFLTTGAEKLKLEDLSTELTAKADTVQAQIEQLGVKLELFNAEASILRTQTQALGESISALNDQTRSISDREAQMHALAKAALADRDKTADELVNEVQQIIQGFADNVEGNITQAAQAWERSQQLTQAAAASAKSSDDRQTQQMLQLSRLGDKVYMTNLYTQVLGSYGDTFARMAARANRVIPQRAPLFAQVMQSAVARQNEMIESARAAINDAATLASGLASGDNDAARTAATIQPVLAVAKQQIEAARINSSGAASIILTPAPVTPVTPVTPAPVESPATQDESDSTGNATQGNTPGQAGSSFLSNWASRAAGAVTGSSTDGQSGSADQNEEPQDTK